MISLIRNDDIDTKKHNQFADQNISNEEDARIDTVIDIAEEHPLVKHSIQINRTRRSNLYFLCMLFIFLFFIIPLIVFFESLKKNENINLNKLALRS